MTATTAKDDLDFEDGLVCPLGTIDRVVRVVCWQLLVIGVIMSLWQKACTEELELLQV